MGVARRRSERRLRRPRRAAARGRHLSKGFRHRRDAYLALVVELREPLDEHTCGDGRDWRLEIMSYHEHKMCTGERQMSNVKCQMSNVKCQMARKDRTKCQRSSRSRRTGSVRALLAKGEWPVAGIERSDVRRDGRLHLCGAPRRVRAAYLCESTKCTGERVQIQIQFSVCVCVRREDSHDETCL